MIMWATRGNFRVVVRSYTWEGSGLILALLLTPILTLILVLILLLRYTVPSSHDRNIRDLKYLKE